MQDNFRDEDDSSENSQLQRLEDDLFEKSDIPELDIIDREKFCFGCDLSKTDFYYYNCGIGLCQDCNFEHIKAQLDKYKTRIYSEIKFVCPSSCKCVTNKEKIELVMTNPIRVLYHDILFKLYVSKKNDIAYCPNSNCNFLGFYNYGCYEKFECQLCKTQWKEMSSQRGFTDYLSIIFESISFTNIKSLIRKFLITKICNKCHSSIERNEGCKHIECNRCEYSFCWNCTTNWEIHQELSCMGLYSNEWDESFRPDFSSPLLIALLIMFVLKFVFSFTIILTILYYLTKAIIFCVLCSFASMSIITNFFFSISETFFKRILRYFAIILTIFVEYWLFTKQLHPFSEKYYFITEIVMILMSSSFISISRRRRR